MCFYSGWSTNRPGSARFSPSDIDPQLCTHLVYTYVNLDPDDRLVPFSTFLDKQNGKSSQRLKWYHRQTFQLMLLAELISKYCNLVKQPATLPARRLFLAVNHDFQGSLTPPYPWRDGEEGIQGWRSGCKNRMIGSVLGGNVLYHRYECSLAPFSCVKVDNFKHYFLPVVFIALLALFSAVNKLGNAKKHRQNLGVSNLWRGK